MIIEFKATDLSTFDGKFDKHLLQIIKQSTGDWKLYVDFTPVKGGTKPSARSCMELAEKAAHNVLMNKVKKGDRHV